MAAGKQLRAGVFTVAVVAFPAVPATAANVNLPLQPGQYAVTVTYEVQEQRQNEPRSATRCIVFRDLDNPERIFDDRMSSSATTEEFCSLRDLRIFGGKISYDADCSNRFVHVTGTIGGTNFSVVRNVRPKGSEKVSLKLTVRGIRTGECSRSREAAKP